MNAGFDREEVAALKEDFENSPTFQYMFTTDQTLEGRWDENGMWDYKDPRICQCFISFCEGAIVGAMTLLSNMENSPHQEENDKFAMSYRMAKQMEETSDQIEIDLSKYLS